MDTIKYKGKEYKVVDDHKGLYRHTIEIIEINPMPELSDDDWVIGEDGDIWEFGAFIARYPTRADSIYEIRKANGVVWRRK